jgi:hypothetical protein
MVMQELIDAWQKESAVELSDQTYDLRLPLDTAAKLEALVELFPLRTREQFIAELLGVALDEVVSAFPYVQGEKVIARDEQGDPMFEDVGHTPRYLQLVSKHMELLAGDERH